MNSQLFYIFQRVSFLQKLKILKVEKKLSYMYNSPDFKAYGFWKEKKRTL